MHGQRFLPYDPHLREYCRYLRNNSTLAEVVLWKSIKDRTMGVQFHRQVPMLHYIVDFFCYDLFLAIEIDGSSHDNKYDYDSRRQSVLQEKGVIFLRFTNDEVLTLLPRVLDAIAAEITEIQGKLDATL